MNPRDIVASRFEIDRLAGTGGMGAVYRALDRQTGQWVALKVLHGHGLDHTERFAREARLLSELRHPGIVRFVGSGLTDRGEGFIVMEWLEGESLSDRLKRGVLSVEEVLSAAARVADALRVAHERGIVHRDLKPQNLFLEQGMLERIKVLDFGIARILDPGQKLTITGAMLGTPGYMSPEQARGDKDVDARTDVYALGCVMFRAITGRRVFEGEDAVSMLIKVTCEVAPRARTLRTEIPPQLDDLLARMLAISADERPRDAAALLAELAVIGGWQMGSTAIHQPASVRSTGPASGFAAMAPSSFVAGPPPSAQAMVPHGGQPTYPAQGHASATAGWSGQMPATTYVSGAAAQTVGSIPGVPMPTQASGPSRSPLLLLGLGGGLLMLLVVMGAVVLYVVSIRGSSTGSVVSGPTAQCPGEKCATSDFRDPGRVDAIKILPQVRKFARTAEGDAELVLLTVTTTNRDGTVNTNDPKNALYFYFQAPDDPNTRLFVWLRGTQMVLSRGPAPTPLSILPTPGCNASAAFRAALPGGPQAGTSTLQLIDSGPPFGAVWQISSGQAWVMLDARSCTVKSLY